MRCFDCEIGGGGELNSTRDLFSAATLQSGDVRITFEWRQRDVAEDFFATAASEQVFAERETVIVSGDQTDEHYWLGAVFEKSMKCFECFLAVAGE